LVENYEHVMYVVAGTAPEGVSTEAFQAANSLFQGAVINGLADNLIDTYLRHKMGNEAWDSFEAQFGVSNACSEQYAME
jgi:hypothetical protein